MKLLISVSIIAVSLCLDIRSPADLNCDFSAGLCKYEATPDSNLTIGHDSETNWNYVTISYGSFGIFYSPAVQTNETQCFQYFYFFSGTVPADIVVQQHFIQGDKIANRSVRSLIRGLDWQSDTFELQSSDRPYQVIIQMNRANASDSLGVTHFKSIADILNCDFSDGFCNYDNGNVTIDHDAGTNWNYVTITDQGTGGILNSPLIHSNETVCFNYFSFVPDLGGTIELIQLFHKGNKISRTVPRLVGSLPWEAGKWELGTYDNMPYEIQIELIRSDSSLKLGISRFEVVHGLC
ncbi:hypothetical protein HDE_05995 [Halotydeus destructor]|nr:hypothetical protein HDE_05995 [Halotydeus destructor]